MQKQCIQALPVSQPSKPIIDVANVSTGYSAASATLHNINNKASFNGSAMDSQDAIWYGQSDQPVLVDPKRRKIVPEPSPAGNTMSLPSVQPIPPSRQLSRMDSEQAVFQFLNNS